MSSREYCFPRIRELWDAIQWALERKPHNFSPVTDDYYLLNTEQLETLSSPEVRVLYFINQEDYKVILIDIHRKVVKHATPIVHNTSS